MEERQREFSPAAHQVLISEFEQLSASFIASETGGDARVSIFVAAAGAILAIGYTNGPKAALESPATQSVAFLAFCFVLVLGWFTLNRIVRRNIVTDDYLEKLMILRRTFEVQYPELTGKLAFPTDQKKEKRKILIRNLAIPLRGGLVEVTIVINGAIAGALFTIVGSWLTGLITAISMTATSAAILVSAGQVAYVNWRYCKDREWDRASLGFKEKKVQSSVPGIASHGVAAP